MSTLTPGKSRRPVRRRPRAFGFRGSSLGLTRGRTDQLIDQIQAGFSFKTLVAFATASGISVSAVASLLGIPDRTLARRRLSGKLAPHESERLLRVATVFEKAVSLFEGDISAAVAWLTRPRKALANQPPLTYARTGIGAREVENLIGRLEYGVFS